MSAPAGGTRWFHVYLNASRPGAEPVGVARQALSPEGDVLREEAVGRDGQWHPTEEFQLQWVGRSDKDLVEVTRELAEDWLEDFRERLRLRAESEADQGG